jgi:hypothetical protein
MGAGGVEDEGSQAVPELFDPPAPGTNDGSHSGEERPAYEHLVMVGEGERVDEEAALQEERQDVDRAPVGHDEELLARLEVGCRFQRPELRLGSGEAPQVQAAGVRDDHRRRRRCVRAATRAMMQVSHGFSGYGLSPAHQGTAASEAAARHPKKKRAIPRATKARGRL